MVTAHTPDEWGKGIILPLPKKGDLSFCNNNRGITLLDIAGKVFSTILLMRVKEEVDIRMRENQAGFRKGRSCSDQIFSLNQVIEKCLDQQLPCLINFIDFKAAFDSVHRPSLWEILKIYGIPSKIFNLVKNSYRETTCAVRRAVHSSHQFFGEVTNQVTDFKSPIFLFQVTKMCYIIQLR